MPNPSVITEGFFFAHAPLPLPFTVYYFDV